MKVDIKNRLVHHFFVERKQFLDVWKDIPQANEVQCNITTKGFNSGTTYFT